MEHDQKPSPMLKNQAARGAAWMVMFKAVDKSIGLLSTLILARLLVPADFGLVAMATAVLAFTQLMGAFGFDSALIQRQDVRREHYDTAWTFNVVVGVLSALVLLVLAVPMASFYNDDRLVAVLIVFSASSLIGGFENIGTVAFRKDLHFRAEFWFLASKRLVSFAVTIALALMFRSYWALVAGGVVGRLMSVWISFRLHPFRPRFSLAAKDDLMHFSKWIFLSSLINFFSSRSTDFVLGKTVGSHELGVYNISLEIASMPSTELIAPINRATYPVYAKLLPDPEALHRQFMVIFGFICLIGFPVAAGLFAVADPFVRVVLGSKWLESIPLIQIFTVCGLVGALQSNLYMMIVAMGKPQASTVLSGCLLLITLPITIWGSSRYGVMGASYAMLFYSASSLCGIIYLFHRITGISPLALGRVAWRPALCSLGMIACVLAFDKQLLSAAPQVLQVVRLGLEVAAGALSYAVLALLAWLACGRPASAEQILLDTARQQWARLLRRRSST